MRALLVIAALILAPVAIAQPALPNPLAGLIGGGDPQAWLDGRTPRATAWVSRRNAAALRGFYAEPRYVAFRDEALAALTAAPSALYLEQRYGEAFALIRDAAHPRGVWSRATLASIKSGRPRWEPLLDIDALAAAERAPLVFTGAPCAPRGLKCAVLLAREGAPGAEAREFDLESRRFVPNGLRAAGVNSVSWLDEDTLAVSAPAPAIKDGQPSVSLVTRSGSAPTELARGAANARLALLTFQDVDGRRAVLLRETPADRSEARSGDRWLLLSVSGVSPLPFPTGAEPVALHKGELVLRDLSGLLSLPLDRPTEPPRRAYQAVPGDDFSAIAASRDALVFFRANGRLGRLSFDGRAWFETEVSGAADPLLRIAAADPEDGEALAARASLSRESPLTVLNLRTGARTAATSMEPPATQAYAANVAGGGKAPYYFAGEPGAAVMLLVGVLDADPARAALWLDKGGALAQVSTRNASDVQAVAEDLVARGLADPKRIALFASGPYADTAARAALANPDRFTAVVLTEIAANGAGVSTELRRGVRLPPTLVLGGGLDPAVGAGRRFAERGLAAGLPITYVEAAEGGPHFERDSSPLERARRAALVHLHLQNVLRR